MQFNRIELAGYLAAKPVVRFLQSGTKVATCRVGETSKFQKNGVEEKRTNWHNLTFYGPLADIAETYEQGVNLFVEGNMQQRKFAPKDGGQERTITDIVVKSSHVIQALPVKEPAEVTVGGPAVADNDWPV